MFGNMCPFILYSGKVSKQIFINYKLTYIVHILSKVFEIVLYKNIFAKFR